MLDALCAGRDRTLDGGGRVGMHGDISPPVVRRLDGGAKLWLREGGDIERAVRRCHAAAAGQLDLRCAQHQLLARTNAHFIWTIGNDACTELLHARLRIADLARQIERLAEIAVATGNRDDRATRIDAGPDDDPFVNRSFKSERGPAQIANRRETAHQRVRGLSAGDQSWYIQNHRPSRQQASAAPASRASACRSDQASTCALRHQSARCQRVDWLESARSRFFRSYCPARAHTTAEKVSHSCHQTRARFRRALQRRWPRNQRRTPPCDCPTPLRQHTTRNTATTINRRCSVMT